VAVLRHRKAQVDARLKRALLDQQRGTMTSPVDGVVLSRAVSNECLLPAGATLLEIGRLEDLEVEADVLSPDVVRFREGSQVDVYGPAVGQPAADGKDHADGTVQKIFPAGFTKISSLGVEQQRVKVIVRINDADLKWLRRERNLGVGYRVRVRIYTAERPQALVIPRSALFRAAGGGWQVYAVRNCRASLQDVQVGLINDEAAEITAGLSEGEQVVLAPESNLEHGARVTVKTTLGEND
jgi:HlyD family secretion protein